MVASTHLRVHGVSVTMWWTLKTMPSVYFAEVYRWVMNELGLTHRLGRTTDEEMNKMYATLVERKAVLRPLLIQRNVEKGLAVPKVHSN